ncbi:unnamed protein product [Moneuplotes crassus]|uniref:Uncharacterized protein n=1 Tax=Euplotes crassus TaxID=5936 RepID=A0AAD1XWA1_EUPCR|nr:unnamed protein product [Moneuplotes crassus]
MHSKLGQENVDPTNQKTLTRSERFSMEHVKRSPLLWVLCVIMLLLIFLLGFFFLFSMPATVESTRRDADIIVPNFDEREYRRIVLPNLMQTILVSDPKSTTASAAVSVGVGSNQNPRDINGLAHLLEHMLFLGSSKYPDGRELQKNAELGGGYSNAYTSPEETNYYFISGEKEFEKSIDIFSWFFKDPTLNSESIEKEVQNVDSEHRKNLNNDSWKAMKLIKGISDVNYTYHDFFTGNVDTLWNIPLENNVNMSKTLRTFYEEYYSSNLMKLVIIGNQTLDELEKLATNKFIGVINKFKRPPKCAFPFRDTKFPLEIRFDPVKNTHSLTIAFMLGINVLKHHESNPLKYISDLITYQGPDSLFWNLKNLNLILDLDAGFVTYKCWSLFEIEFTLTDKGVETHEYVIQSFFLWLEYVRQNYESQDIWEIMSKVSEYDFYYMSQKPSTSDSSALASNMHKYPFKYVYATDSILLEQDNEAFKMVLDSVTVDNMLLLFSSPEMSNKNSSVYTDFSQKEEFYGTEYSLLPIDHFKMDSYGYPELDEGKLVLANNSEFIDPKKFKISAKNNFFPKQMEMVCYGTWNPLRFIMDVTHDCGEEAMKADGESITPTLLAKDNKGELWHKLDRSFKIPVANIRIRIETDKGNDNLKQSTTLYFFESLLGEWILENLYDALQMSYSFTFTATANGLEMNIEGYNDKILELTETLLKSFKNLEITEFKFEAIKVKFLNDLENLKTDQPFKLAFMFSKILYREHGHSFNQIFEAAKNLTLEDVENLHSELFNQAYIKTLVHGNILGKQASIFKQSIDSILQAGTLDNPAKAVTRLHFLDGPYVYAYHSFNPDEQDSAVFNTYQVSFIENRVPASIRDLICLNMISSLISNFAYNYLRTERQLGYIASSGAFSIGRSGFLYVTIQGNKESPQEMDNHIEEMLREFRSQEIRNMTQEEFEVVRDSVRQQITQPDQSLSDRTARIWKDITIIDQDFKIREKSLEQLDSLTLEELEDIYVRKIAPDDPKDVQKLSVQFYSSAQYPTLPTEFPNAFTKYKGINELNEEFVKSQF